MAVCTQCGTENPPVAKFCMSCGAPVAAVDAPPVRHEERRPVTAVFVDIVGSTSRAENLDPEDVLALLEPYYAQLRQVLERHGGTVEKFIGDAVVALFGAPVAHEDDPERAVRAGLAILNSIAFLNEEDSTRELRVRIGITTGEAIVSLGARVGEGQGMAWGDVLNTAARLQSAAPVNGVLVDERTYRACGSAIELRKAEPIIAKGKVEPVRVWEAVGVREDGSRRGSARFRFVGRSAELARLDAAWHGVAATGTSAFAIVVGEPGLGKSRLVSEIAARAEGAEVRVGGCLSYGEGITYWPVAQIVRATAGILAGDGGPVVSAKLDALLNRLVVDDLDQLRTIASAVSNLVGAPTTPRGTYATTQISQAELHWGIQRLFELLAAQRPLVLLLEDLHWAEPTLIELLESLLAAQAPLFVLATARPEITDLHPGLVVGGDRRTVITLHELSDEESDALVVELVDDLVEQGLPRATIERLVRNAHGNPLFLEETVQMLLEAESLDPAALESLAMPESLQALVAARLDGLPAAERRLAQHTSVVGTSFWSGAAARLDDRTEPPNDLLESLQRRTIVHEHAVSAVAGDREWEFKHALIRDVAYGRVPKGRRVGLHVRFADWISDLPEGGGEFVEILAYHLEQACLLARDVGRTDVPAPLERAVDALRRAGEKSELHEGMREAHRFYTRALELVPEADRSTRVDLALRRAYAMIGQGELGPAAEALEEIVSESAALGLDAVRCDALVALGNVAKQRGLEEEALRSLGLAEQLADEIGDRRLAIRAAYEAAWSEAWFGGDADEAIAKLDRTLALSADEGDSVLQIQGLLRIGMLLMNVARLGEAEPWLTRCAELASELGSVRDAARVEHNLGLISYYNGDLASAEGRFLQAQEWLERTADGLFVIQNRRALAMLALASGNAAAAEDHLTVVLPLARSSGGYLAVEVERLLTETLLSLGRQEEARRLGEESLRVVAAEDAGALASGRRIEAHLAVVDGDRARALEAFAEAIRLLEELQSWIEVAETRLDLARALAGLGDDAAAREERTRAEALFASIGLAALPGAAATT